MGLRQRKVREGIESLRERHNGMEALNNHEQLETWKLILKKTILNYILPRS